MFCVNKIVSIVGHFSLTRSLSLVIINNSHVSFVSLWEGWSHAASSCLSVQAWTDVPYVVWLRWTDAKSVFVSVHMSVQELQRDIEQHTEGIASVLSLCDVLLRDEDATGGTEAESDSLQETSRSLDQRWRTICAMALDRRLRSN